MTTIVYKDKVIAADTQVSADFIWQVEFSKIQDCDTVYICGCGELALAEKWIDWYCINEADPDKFKKRYKKIAPGMMVINKETGLFDYYEYHSPYPIMEGTSMPFAIGSGGNFAMGAMAHGANAKEAVIAASKLDPDTNDIVQVIDLNENI